MTKDGGQPVTPRAAQVLRNVALHPEAHTLARPGALAPASAGELTPSSASALAVAAPAAPPQSAAERKLELDQACRRAYEKGRIKGRQETLDEAAAAELQTAREHGLADGMAAAQEAADASVKAVLVRLDAMLRALPEQVQHRLAAVEDDMVALCFEAIVRMLGAAAAGEEGVRAMVRHLVGQFGARKIAAIHVHPDDMQSLKGDAGIRHWLKERQQEPVVQLVGDNAVELGGAILRSPGGSLDARLEVQVDALRTLLVSVRADRAAAHLASAQNAVANGVPAAAKDKP